MKGLALENWLERRRIAAADEALPAMPSERIAPFTLKQGQYPERRGFELHEYAEHGASERAGQAVDI